jgi:tripartite-type tricarboxylate transporter receptor subunit TctC
MKSFSVRPTIAMRLTPAVAWPRKKREMWVFQKFCVAVLAAFAGFVLVQSAPAQGQYPERNITVIVPMVPGGQTDVLARQVGQYVHTKLGKPVVVENRPGGGTTIGVVAAARSKPDGYTLLSISDAIAINQSLHANAKYDVLRDFTGVTDLLASPNVLFVRTDSPIKTFAQLLEMEKKNPGGLNYASPGMGTPPYIAMEVLKAKTGMKTVHVTFPGAAPQMQAVLGGQVEIGILGLGGPYVHLQSGQLRALLIMDDKRWTELPDVPTAAEMGIDLPRTVWKNNQALYAPAGTPADVIDTVSRLASEAMMEPATRQKWEQTGNRITAQGPAALNERIKRDAATFKDIFQELNIRVN